MPHKTGDKYMLSFALIPLVVDLGIVAALAFVAFSDVSETNLVLSELIFNSLLPVLAFFTFALAVFASWFLYNYQNIYTVSRSLLYLLSGIFISAFAAVIWLISENMDLLGVLLN